MEMPRAGHLFEDWALARMLQHGVGLVDLVQGRQELMAAWDAADLATRLKVIRSIRPEVRP